MSTKCHIYFDKDVLMWPHCTFIALSTVLTTVIEPGELYIDAHYGDLMDSCVPLKVNDGNKQANNEHHLYGSAYNDIIICLIAIGICVD